MRWALYMRALVCRAKCNRVAPKMPSRHVIDHKIRRCNCTIWRKFARHNSIHPLGISLIIIYRTLPARNNKKELLPRRELCDSKWLWFGYICIYKTDIAKHITIWLHSPNILYADQVQGQHCIVICGCTTGDIYMLYIAGQLDNFAAYGTLARDVQYLHSIRLPFAVRRWNSARRNWVLRWRIWPFYLYIYSRICIQSNQQKSYYTGCPIRRRYRRSEKGKLLLVKVLSCRDNGIL